MDFKSALKAKQCIRLYPFFKLRWRCDLMPLPVGTLSDELCCLFAFRIDFYSLVQKIFADQTLINKVYLTSWCAEGETDTKRWPSEHFQSQSSSTYLLLLQYYSRTHLYIHTFMQVFTTTLLTQPPHYVLHCNRQYPVANLLRVHPYDISLQIGRGHLLSWAFHFPSLALSGSGIGVSWLNC